MDAAAATAPKKKRGFWSKLFGIGGNDEPTSPTHDCPAEEARAA